MFSFPVVTWSLITVNVAIFLMTIVQGPQAVERITFEYSTIPRNIMGGDLVILMSAAGPVAAIDENGVVEGYIHDFDSSRLRIHDTLDGPRYEYVFDGFDREPLEPVRQKLPSWLTLVTAMFMHAGWLHLLGNMWFLKVFGTTVEDSVGKLRYLGFYLLCGLGASGAQLFHDTGSIIPFLGASGAIAGVMGAFAFRFPGATVLTLIPIILYSLAHLPAWVFMLIYLGQQIFMSVVHSEQSGGVAWWAHIGGFAAGYALIRLFPLSGKWREVFQRVEERRFS